MPSAATGSHGAAEDYQVAREFEALATRDEKLQLLRALFTVSAQHGITTVEALKMTGRQIGNVIHRRSFNEATDRVIEGEGLSRALERMNCFPPLTLDQLGAPRMPFLIAGVGLQIVVGLLRRDVWRLAVGAVVIFGWGSTILWRGYRDLREEVAGLDFIAASLALLPVAVLISLGKAGALVWRTAVVTTPAPREE